MSNLIPNQKSSRKKRKKPRRRLSPTLARIANRTLTVTEEDLRTFLPTELLVRIGEAFLEGAMTYSEVSAMIDVPVASVSQALKDSVASAWLFNHLRQAIPARIGMVDVALFNKARGGDVAAMKLFYDLAGEIVRRVQVTGANMSLNFNPEQLSEEQLDRFIEGYRRKGGGGACIHGSSRGRRGMGGDTESQRSSMGRSDRDSNRTNELRVATGNAGEVGRVDLSSPPLEAQGSGDSLEMASVGARSKSSVRSDSSVSSDEEKSSSDFIVTSETSEQETQASNTRRSRVSRSVSSSNSAPEQKRQSR